jgi:hypothetical protein
VKPSLHFIIAGAGSRGCIPAHPASVFYRTRTVLSNAQYRCGVVHRSWVWTLLSGDMSPRYRTRFIHNADLRAPHPGGESGGGGVGPLMGTGYRIRPGAKAFERYPTLTEPITEVTSITPTKITSAISVVISITHNTTFSQGSS